MPKTWPTDEERCSDKNSIYLGHYSSGGYSTELLGTFEWRPSLPNGRNLIFGAQVRQQCDPAVTEGREPLGLVAGPFWGPDAEVQANAAAREAWHNWAVRVGRNCGNCGYVREWCGCRTPHFEKEYTGK